MKVTTIMKVALIAIVGSPTTAALDAKQGTPQTYKETPLGKDLIQLDIHIPCPGWLQRRWDCIGERINESVFSYQFDSMEIESEVKILSEQLWMAPE